MIPDKIKNIHVLLLNELIVPMDPVISIMIQEKTNTTIVRMAVAASESIFRIPHFARIDVNPAKTAEPNANKIHITSSPLSAAVVYSCLFIIHLNELCGL